MSKSQRRPLRSVSTETTIYLPGSPDKPAVLVKRKARPKTPTEAKAGPEKPCRAPRRAVAKPAPSPPAPRPSRTLGGRPRTLDDPCKVLVTLEQCDVDALEGWRARRGYPHRSAAVRAMIAEVCRHG